MGAPSRRNSMALCSMPEPEDLPRESVPLQMLNTVGNALSSFAGYLAKPKKATTLSKRRRNTFGKLRKAVKARAFHRQVAKAVTLEYDPEDQTIRESEPELELGNPSPALPVRDELPRCSLGCRPYLKKVYH